MPLNQQDEYRLHDRLELVRRNISAPLWGTETGFEARSARVVAVAVSLSSSSRIPVKSASWSIP